MITVRLENGRVVEKLAEFPKGDAAGWAAGRYENRNDWRTLDRAQEVATQLTEVTGELHVATETPNQYPRFDVVRAPAVGDKVSYAFNGDYYPDGEIVKVSDSLRVVTTSSGKRYFRQGATARWVNGGMWGLVQGHVSRLNPEF